MIFVYTNQTEVSAYAILFVNKKKSLKNNALLY